MPSIKLSLRVLAISCLFLLTACITSVDTADITGYFLDPDATIQTNAGDLHDTIYIKVLVQFSYNPNFFEDDPPHLQDRIAVSFTITDDAGASDTFSGPFDTTEFADGFYNIVAHAVATGFFDTGAADSSQYSVYLANGIDYPNKKKKGDPHGDDPTNCAQAPNNYPQTAKRSTSGVTSPKLSGQFGADPVNVVTGALYMQEEDDAFPAPGSIIQLTRYYNSRSRDSRSFGRGWSFIYDRRLTVDGRQAIVEEDGQGSQFAFNPNEDGSYRAPHGVKADVDVSAACQVTITRGRCAFYRYDKPSGLNASCADTGGRLVAIGNCAGNQTSFFYQSDGTLARLQDPVGRQVVFVGSNGLITRATLPDGEIYTYTYDHNGNVIGVTDATGGAETYTFDELNRLTAATVPTYRLKGKTPRLTGTSTISWGFDPAGNRTSETVDGATTFASYDDANELIASGTTTFAYDASGNMVGRVSGKDELRLNYSVDGQILRATALTSGKVTGDESYQYDPFGSRTVRTSAHGTSFFEFEGVHAKAQYESGGSGATTRYVQDHAGQALVQFDPAKKGSEQYLYQDRVGSVVAIANGSARVTDRFQFDPFGRLVGGNSGSTGLLYAGFQQDDTTGLLYGVLRHYDPISGRWASRDPLGTIDGSNLYAYAGNNPITFVDREGAFLNLIVGGAVSVGIEYLIARASNRPFTTAQAARAFALGAVTSGIGALANLGNLARTAALVGGIAATNTAFDLAALSPCSRSIAAAGNLFGANLVGAAFNTLLGKGIAMLPRAIGNNLKGKAFEDLLADFVRSKGMQVAQQQIRQTPFGDRIIDILAKTKEGFEFALETKAGGSRYTFSQRAKDLYLFMNNRLPTWVAREVRLPLGIQVNFEWGPAKLVAWATGLRR